MRRYVVVWYDALELFGRILPGMFEPNDFRMFGNFEDAMHCLDLNIHAGHTCEIWMHDPSHQWNRIRFQTGHTDHNDYV